MWDKLDEVLIALIGAVVLGCIGLYAIQQGFDGGTAQACIVAIAAVLSGALGLKGRSNGGENSGAVSA